MQNGVFLLLGLLAGQASQDDFANKWYLMKPPPFQRSASRVVATQDQEAGSGATFDSLGAIKLFYSRLKGRVLGCSIKKGMTMEEVDTKVPHDAIYPLINGFLAGGLGFQWATYDDLGVVIHYQSDSEHVYRVSGVSFLPLVEWPHFCRPAIFNTVVPTLRTCLGLVSLAVGSKVFKESQPPDAYVSVMGEALEWCFLLRRWQREFQLLVSRLTANSQPSAKPFDAE